MISSHALWGGFWRLSAVGAIVVAFGIAWGVAAKDAGLDDGLIIAMSAVVFAGASQFASIELWAGPMDLLALFLITVAVNARHILMGTTLYPDLKDLPWWQQMVSVLVLTDAPYAMTQAESDRTRRIALIIGGGWMIWLTWMIGTVIGVFFGSVLGDTRIYGFDALMPIFFSVMLVSVFKGRQSVLPFLGAGVASLAWYLAFPGNWHVIVGALVGGAINVMQGEEAS